MKKLYILGNGFDLYHNLPTKYSDFNEYVDKNNEELSLFFEENFNFQLNEEGLWKDFEEGLGTFDSYCFLSRYNFIDISSDDFRPKELYGLEDELEEVSSEKIDQICNAFYDWLNQIDFSKKSVHILDIDKNATFINFNYTDTLIRYYSVEKKNVLHIHSSINSNEDLIFGHGIQLEEEYDKDGIPLNAGPFYESEIRSQAIMSFFYKDTGAIIKKHNKFFDKLYGIDEILILGLSLSNIDMPYIDFLHKKFKNAKWIVSYYSPFEKEFILNQLMNIGIDNIIQKKMEDINSR